MPRPHYPAQGGTRHPNLAHVSPETARRRPERNAPQNNAAPPVFTDAGRPQALQAEVERLNRELAQAKNAAPAPRSAEMLRAFWIAAALCGGSLLFALMALWRRG